MVRKRVKDRDKEIRRLKRRKRVSGRNQRFFAASRREVSNKVIKTDDGTIKENWLFTVVCYMEPPGIL